jgi:hypothetical protein
MTEQLFHIATAPFEAALRVPMLPPGIAPDACMGTATARVRAALPAGLDAEGGGRL